MHEIPSSQRKRLSGICLLEESLSSDEEKNEQRSGVQLAKHNTKSKIQIWNDPEPINDGIEIWKNAKQEKNLSDSAEDDGQQCVENRKRIPRKNDIVVFYDKSNWILGRLHKYFRASNMDCA